MASTSGRWRYERGWRGRLLTTVQLLAVTVACDSFSERPPCDANIDLCEAPNFQPPFPGNTTGPFPNPQPALGGTSAGGSMPTAGAFTNGGVTSGGSAGAGTGGVPLSGSSGSGGTSEGGEGGGGGEAGQVTTGGETAAGAGAGGEGGQGQPAEGGAGGNP